MLSKAISQVTLQLARKTLEPQMFRKGEIYSCLGIFVLAAQVKEWKSQFRGKIESVLFFSPAAFPLLDLKGRGDFNCLT